MVYVDGDTICPVEKQLELASSIPAKQSEATLYEVEHTDQGLNSDEAYEIFMQGLSKAAEPLDYYQCSKLLL